MIAGRSSQTDLQSLPAGSSLTKPGNDVPSPFSLYHLNQLLEAERSRAIERSAYPLEPLLRTRHFHRCMFSKSHGDDLSCEQFRNQVRLVLSRGQRELKALGPRIEAAKKSGLKD